jgi:aryl-alcohol dehydrogenase-like predicted oxidoreductase
MSTSAPAPAPASLAGAAPASAPAAADPMFGATTAIAPPPFFNKPAFVKNGMQYIYLGSTGAVVSRLGLGLMPYAKDAPDSSKWGAWVLPAAEGEVFIKQALDAGINFFDSSEIYSLGRSEEFFGAALKKLLPGSQFTREDLVISTKIFPARTLGPATDSTPLQRSLSRKAIFSAVGGSLRRLQVDYIDLYFIHRFDPNTAPEETMKALHDLVQSGKIRYIGASSMYLWQFVKLQSAAERRGWTKFTVMQNHHNALYREEEREMNPYCLDTGVATTPYSPLASGVLLREPGTTDSKRASTDKIQQGRYFKQGDDAVINAVLNVAHARGVPAAHVALAWLWSKPVVGAPIIGATKPHHISDAVGALDFKLTVEEIACIEKEYLPHAVSGFS